MLLTLSEAERKLRGDLHYFLAERIPAYLQDCDSFPQKKEIAQRQNKEKYGSDFLQWRPLPAPPIPPVLGLKVPTGLGKSHTTFDKVKTFVKTHGGPVYYFVPTHKLADEQTEKFNKDAEDGLRARTIRGLSQTDPDSDGEKMCLRYPVIKPLLKLGISHSEFCKKEKTYCPHHPHAGKDTPCGYLSQFDDPPDIFILPHQYLFMPLSGMPEPSLIIIDESYWQSRLVGCDGHSPMRVSLSTLTSNPIGNKLFKLLLRKDNNPISRRDLIVAGISYNNLKDFIEEAREAYKHAQISPKITASGADAAAEFIKTKVNYRLILLFEELKACLNNLSAVPPLLKIRKNIALPGGEGSADFLYFSYKKPLSPNWFNKSPTLILDATLPEQIVKHDFYQLEVISYNVPMPHAYIEQISDKELSARMMIPFPSAGERKNKELERNLQRLFKFLLVRNDLAQIVTNPSNPDSPSILLIGQKELENNLKRMGLPALIETAHFNAIKGLNCYSDIPIIVIAGRPLPPPADVEKIRAVMFGPPTTSLGGNWYLKRKKPITLRTNEVHYVDACYHPDSLTEEIRWQICEAELIQAIGRARGIRRTAENPVRIIILNNIPLPFPIDQITTWNEILPNSFDLALVETGIVPLTPGELTRICPQQFKDADTAKYALQSAGGPGGVVAQFIWGGNPPISNPIGNLPPQTHRPWVVQYKRRGRGHGPNRIFALVHERYTDPIAALVAKVGPVSECIITDPQDVINLPKSSDINNLMANLSL